MPIDGRPFSLDVECDPIHLAAADWFVRLQSEGVSIDDILAWHTWLSANPRHSEAIARIEEVAQMVRAVPLGSLISASRLTRDSYDASVSIRDWHASHSAIRRRGIARIVVSLATWLGSFGRGGREPLGKREYKK